MSPEQVQGQPLDSSTDIFSMGVVFYELLTGHLPFGGNNGSEIVNAMINSAPPPIRSHGGNFPQEIERLLAMALAKGRFYRYLGVRQFRDDLLRLKSKLEKEEIRTLFDSGLRFLETKDVGEFLTVLIKIFSINPASEELAQLFQYSKTLEPKNLNGLQAEALKRLYIFETYAFNAHTGGAIWTNFICQPPAKTVAQIPANESAAHCSRSGDEGPNLRLMLNENNLKILYWSSLVLVLMSLLAWYFAR